MTEFVNISESDEGTSKKEKSPFETLACTNTAVRRAARRLGNLYDEALASLGLKATQVALLSEIERMFTAAGGQSPALQDLALNMAVQISALTHALRPLIRDGLIELQGDEADKRVKRAVLTKTGSERLHQAIVHWAIVNNRVDEILGKEAAAQLRALADFVASDEFLTAYGVKPADSFTHDLD
ncbi:MarR family transcriptional regulator [Pseudomonas sp. 7P_10.2_Bac1]|uniref:MarR family winged helix-turn-helix transcriptional regulator n=1 Tax=Pseudomonas sp. 7P_10.2_Bac1 TaxID=2971614 RepID=UPI0021C98670|nr:MarR family transcriptional regulator [Pseudomonas sp. 7P_10.2_Bac1]MCU1726232.1 MarR family transcriptional regulator [Pseudomonas sp. 7P_10.2_Bac1]